MRTRGITWQEVADATCGRVVDMASAARIDGVSTDTRTLQPNALFVALRGPRFDGHDYVRQALEAGAAGVMLAEDRPEPRGGRPLVLVDDTLDALGSLASYYVQALGARVVAITGSVGKTTTKELIAHLLGDDTYRTPGNLNNLIGLPLTVLNAPGTPRTLVLEMGMSEPGEIARLAAIAKPQIALITNVAAAHLDILGDIGGVARAKGELFAALTPGSTAVVNLDDPHVVAQAQHCAATQVTFGRERSADVALTAVSPTADGFALTFAIAGAQMRTEIATPAEHNAQNAAAAVAVAVAAGVEPEQLMARLRCFNFSLDRRMSVREIAGVTWIDDCYNANPLSMRSALKTLARVANGRPTVALLGDMLELGSYSERAHSELGELLRAAALERFVAVGPMMCYAAAAYGPGCDAVESSLAARDLIRDAIPPGAVVLVKGSRGMRMERILPEVD